MPRTRAWPRAAWSAIALSCTLAATSSAQDASLTTTTRTKGDHLSSGFEAFGDCVQRSLFASAESSVSKTRVAGTQTTGEVTRTVVNMADYNLCTNTQVSFSAEWPDLQGVSWDIQSGNASMIFSRPVDVQRCQWTAELGQVCETHSEILSMNVVFTGTGDFEDSVYVYKETRAGSFRKERTRALVKKLLPTYSIQLNGQEYVASTASAQLDTARVGTITTGPL